MKCKNCDKELEQVEGKKVRKFCDEKCRSAFRRKAVVKCGQSNPVESKAVAKPEPQKRSFPQTFKDANKKDHPIDYAGRRANTKLMVKWAKGTDGAKRESLGRLDLYYRHAKDIDLAEFLGLDMTLKEFEKEGYYWPWWEKETVAYAAAHPKEAK